METLKFKTNIKCGGCVATVTPVLNSIEGINNWEVDLVNTDKILTVETEDNLAAVDVVAAVEKAGFKAEKI